MEHALKWPYMEKVEVYPEGSFLPAGHNSYARNFKFGMKSCSKTMVAITLKSCLT